MVLCNLIFVDALGIQTFNMTYIKLLPLLCYDIFRSSLQDNQDLESYFFPLTFKFEKS